MLDVLNFAFASFWHFAGCCVLLIVAGVAIGSAR